jgi:hypothetical protein
MNALVRRVAFRLLAAGVLAAALVSGAGDKVPIPSAAAAQVRGKNGDGSQRGSDREREEFRRGYRQGFRDGYEDGRDGGRKHGYKDAGGNSPFERGYAQGYEAGFREGRDREPPWSQYEQRSAPRRK